MEIIKGHWYRLCDKRPPGWNCDGKMDRYLSRVVKIRKITDFGNMYIEQDEDDTYQWVFSPKDFVEEVLVERGSNPSKYSFEDMLCGVTYESKEK